jgi:hypothetical protein
MGVHDPSRVFPVWIIAMIFALLRARFCRKIFPTLYLSDIYLKKTAFRYKKKKRDYSLFSYAVTQ